MDDAHRIFTLLFTSHRKRVGTMREVARICGYSHSYISEIERGTYVPTRDTAINFDRLFGTGPDHPDAAGAITDAAGIVRGAARTAASSIDTSNGVDAADAVHAREMDEMERRRLLQAMGLTGAVSAAGTFGHLEAVRATLDDTLERSVEEWEEVAFDYGRDFFTVPPSGLIDELARDVLAVRRLLDRPGSAGDRASLQRVGAQLSVITAMTLGNLGELDHARRWWRTARTAADRSGDAELSTWVRGRQAMRATSEGTLDEALAIADRALARALQQVGAGKMWALTARARALARHGDREQAHAAVEGLADAFERLPDAVTADRTTVYGWAEQRLRHTESDVYARFGDSRAPDAQDAALALYPQGHRGNRSQVKLHQAGWLVHTGDPSEGLRYATQVVSALPPGFAYGLLVAARDVQRALPASADNTPEAAEYRELLATSS